MPGENTEQGQGSDVERLFTMVERKPFQERDVSEVIEQQTAVPLGTGQVAQDLIMPPSMVDYIRGGLYNAKFLEGPDDGTGSAIDDINNKLPGWVLYTEGTGSTTCVVTWEDDTAAAVGQNITFTFTTAAQNDICAIEQTVPILGFGKFHVPFYRINTDADETNFSTYVGLTYLKYDLTTASGIDTTFLDDPLKAAPSTGDEIYRHAPYVWSKPPADAAFLRVRFGFKKINAGTDSAVLEVRETSIEAPGHQFMTYLCAHVDVPADTNTDIYPVDRGQTGALNAAASRVVPDLPGYWVGLGGRLGGAVTSGTLAVRARDLGNSVSSSLVMDWAAGNQNRHATIDWDSETLGKPEFAARSKLGAYMNPISMDPTTRDLMVTVRCLLMDTPYFVTEA